MVVQINKIDLTLTSNLTLTLFPNTNSLPNLKPDPNPNLKLKEIISVYNLELLCRKLWCCIDC